VGNGKHADAAVRRLVRRPHRLPAGRRGDAQINQTGYMHNRLRMVTASFLCKDLGIDWRRGERYFAEKLNDFDLAANNGGWQWASSSGCDAQPYFRIFNPVTPERAFDPEGKFIRRYLPQLAGCRTRPSMRRGRPRRWSWRRPACWAGLPAAHRAAAARGDRRYGAREDAAAAMRW
jgi:hypothetical protein